MNRQGTITIPWPTRSDIPVSEFITQLFLTLAFPALFPYGSGDFFINRPISITSMSDWAEHLRQVDSAMLRKEIVQNCDTQCTEGDCDVILIKN